MATIYTVQAAFIHVRFPPIADIGELTDVAGMKTLIRAAMLTTLLP